MLIKKLNLGSRKAPVTGVQSNLLRYLPLNQDYSVVAEYNKFGPTRMNVMNLSFGLENVIMVS